MKLLALSALLVLLAVSAMATEGDVIEPNTKTTWKLKVNKDGGQQTVNVYTSTSKLVATVRGTDRQSLVQQLDKVLEMSRTATFRKATGPQKEIASSKDSPTPIAFEVKDSVQFATIGKNRLTIEEVKGLRDLLSRMDSYLAEGQKQNAAK